MLDEPFEDELLSVSPSLLLPALLLPALLLPVSCSTGDATDLNAAHSLQVRIRHDIKLSSVCIKRFKVLYSSAGID